MIITKIETLRVGIPYDPNGPRVPMRPGLKPRYKFESLIVRVETEDGLAGWGEGFGHFVNPGTEAVLRSLIGPWFLGRDAQPVVSLMEEAQQQVFSAGRNGPVFYALSAIDIALWDLVGQRAGQPLFRLFGGKDGTLQRYASMVRYGGNVDAIRSNCMKAGGEGYKAIKLHENTLPAFLAARECTDPETKIMLDVNCCWSVDEARDIARAIRDRGFYWLEEPVWPPEDFSGMAAVRKEGVTIAAGENIGTLHEFRRAFEAGAFDIAQPSVIKAGGVTQLVRIFALAGAHSVKVVPHSPYWGPGYLATAHVGASQPRPPLVETTYVTLESAPYELYNAQQPTFTLPEVPGLGFDPDWNVLESNMLNRQAVVPT